jgi:hypothetical protein
MSCDGSMMRATFQPLAHLVDAAAEMWLAVEHASESERRATQMEIGRTFFIGDRNELTFHGARYLLTLSHLDNGDTEETSVYEIEVHEIALNG